MNIKKVATVTPIINTEGRNLRPLKEHIGVTLKLTKEEKTQVEKYEDSISELECELYKLYQHLKPVMSSKERDFWSDKIISYEYRIEHLKELIREIKINRYSIQKAEQKLSEKNS